METEASMIARPPTTDDIVLMSTVMRGADVEEALAMGFATPYDAILASVHNSSESFAVRSSEGVLLGLFGLVVLANQPGFGMPWLVTSVEISQKPMSLIKSTKAIVEHWRESLSLYNWVHDDNAQAKGFIRVVGFKIEPTPQMLPHAGTGELFNLFWMGDKPCVS